MTTTVSTQIGTETQTTVQLTTELTTDYETATTTAVSTQLGTETQTTIQVTTELTTDYETATTTNYETATATSTEIGTETQTTIQISTEVSTAYETGTTTATSTEIGTETQTTVQTATATATQLCDARPVQGGAFYDLDDWTYYPVYGYGFSYDIPTSGGSPGFYFQNTCDAAATGGDNWQEVVQTITICPGLTYNWSFAYQFQGDTSVYSSCDFTLQIQETPIAGVYGGAPLDTLGNPSGNQNVAQGDPQPWYTLSGTWSSGYFATAYREVSIGVRTHCGAANIMTVGVDSFKFEAQLS
ncbi:uncharacterized protein LTR77_005016 [Saxophila tyrrhenica]|uniref:Uncharacterized protein n=1 Tax=Saxophila tyrrhenica TaxID=1690608 RepID=A0AAV9PBJ6_9PEZI|nr:hypothetical protein LTR77_005016 [Saxophila tyrrhenica]